MHFLYMGFSQQANVRSFRFQGVLNKDRSRPLTKNLDILLCADMALLAEYRIRVQDGPALCLRILAAALSGEDIDSVQFSHYAITRADVSSFTSARDAIEESKAARRKPRAPFKPAPASQLKWPQVR
jgi:hypothetical protein